MSCLLRVDNVCFQYQGEEDTWVRKRSGGRLYPHLGDQRKLSAVVTDDSVNFQTEFGRSS